MPAKKKSEIIRNLRPTAVHQRFRAFGVEKPYRIEFQPRGLRGDTHEIPIQYTESGEYQRNKGVLFEVITRAEALKLEETYPLVGYQGGARQGQMLVGGELVDGPVTVSVENTQNNTVATVQELSRAVDGQDGVKVHMVGPNYADMPGSDAALHSMLRNEQQKAEGVAPQSNAEIMSQKERVILERTQQAGAKAAHTVVDPTVPVDPKNETIKTEASSHPATRKPQNRAAVQKKTALKPRGK